MRNAMICVSVMLAIFLGWPLAFGAKHGRFDLGGAEAARPMLSAAVTAPKTPAVAAQPEVFRPESCYHHYQREVKQCSDGNSAACRLRAADRWDMCEATGFWHD